MCYYFEKNVQSYVIRVEKMYAMNGAPMMIYVWTQQDTTLRIALIVPIYDWMIIQAYLQIFFLVIWNRCEFET